MNNSFYLACQGPSVPRGEVNHNTIGMGGERGGVTLKLCGHIIWYYLILIILRMVPKSVDIQLKVYTNHTHMQIPWVYNDGGGVNYMHDTCTHPCERVNTRV